MQLLFENMAQPAYLCHVKNLMNNRIFIRLAIIAIAGIIGLFTQKDKLTGGGGDGSNSPRVENHQNDLKLKENLNFDKSDKGLVMKNVTIKNYDKVVYRGDVDLVPTLNRIKAGKRDSHSNDGSTFGNREKRLPQKEHGYYKEYVIRTPNVNHAGPQRLVIGRNNEIYYTHDHYKTFKRVK